MESKTCLGESSRANGDLENDERVKLSIKTVFAMK